MDHSDSSSGSWEDIDELHNCSTIETSHFMLDNCEVVQVIEPADLVNTNEHGCLAVTNYRMLFLGKKGTQVIKLGSIPLATIEKVKKDDALAGQSRLWVFGKDTRTLVFSFMPQTDKRKVIYDALLRCGNPALTSDLYAFKLGPSTSANTSPLVRLLAEYFRLLGKDSDCASMDMIQSGSYTLSNDRWRISSVNSKYTLCTSYPFSLLVPKTISDYEIKRASCFRSNYRVPVITWCDRETGAVIARSSQPLVGFSYSRSDDMDEKLMAALCSRLDDGSPRKLYIADARPYLNTVVSEGAGGGTESSSNYSFQCEAVLLGIDNIHEIRKSFFKLQKYLDDHGITSSDGMSSFSRPSSFSLKPLWDFGLTCVATSVSVLYDSKWLFHVQRVLAGASWIAAHVAMEKASVLVHCSDGWDRTSQLVSLASMLLDPYYRTFTGFQALVEKDWLAFGHLFSDRMGLQSLSEEPSESYSPIFLQWVDCVSQLLRLYPRAFQFSAAFLVDFLDCVLSGRFGNFLCNSEKERQECQVFEACRCLWAYMLDLRTPSGASHKHYNSFYNPEEHNGHILPPAAALAPTLWPEFYFRWACPEESKLGGAGSTM